MANLLEVVRQPGVTSGGCASTLSCGESLTNRFFAAPMLGGGPVGIFSSPLRFGRRKVVGASTAIRLPRAAQSVVTIPSCKSCLLQLVFRSHLLFRFGGSWLFRFRELRNGGMHTLASTTEFSLPVDPSHHPPTAAARPENHWLSTIGF